jgi:hypothetical protein
MVSAIFRLSYNKIFTIESHKSDLMHRGISSTLSQKSRTKEKSLKNIQVVLEQKERVKMLPFRQ